MNPKPRPKLVTTLTLGVLTFATLHLIRFGLGLTLPDLPLTVPAWYIPFTGALWGAGGLIAAYGLYRGAEWAPLVARWGGLAFALWFWADRLLLAQSDYARRSIPASAVMTALALVGLWWTLRQSHVRSYYGER